MSAAGDKFRADLAVPEHGSAPQLVRARQSHQPNELVVPGEHPALGHVLRFVLFATSAGEARDRVTAMAEIWHEEGQLIPARPRILVGAVREPGTFGFGPPRKFELCAHAQELLDEGLYDSAVITAQVACEVWFEVALRILLGPVDADQATPAPLISERLVPQEAKACKVWHAVTGEHIDDQPFWREYRDVVARRDRVVHSAERMSELEAEESVRTAKVVCDYIAGAWIRTRTTARAASA
jgi:hypothetical protein